MQKDVKYMREIENLVESCQNNKLALNISKFKELIVDFRKGKPRDHAPAFIGRLVVERLNSFKFLSVCMFDDPS